MVDQAVPRLTFDDGQRVSNRMLVLQDKKQDSSDDVGRQEMCVHGTRCSDEQFISAKYVSFM